VQWYNKRKNRSGSLFNRFDSTIIEDGRAMAFITLNPVRAGMVTDPADYHWCGYTYRLAHGKLDPNDVMLVRSLHGSLQLPQQIMKLPEKKQLQLLWKYFRLRLLRANAKDRNSGASTVGQKMEQEGKPLEFDLARHFMLKVRFATKGIAIGSESFVEEILSTCGTVLGYKRQHHANDYHVWDHIHSLKKHTRVFS